MTKVEMICPKCGTNLDTNLERGEAIHVPQHIGNHEVPDKRQTCFCCKAKLKIIAKITKTLHLEVVE